MTLERRYVLDEPATDDSAARVGEAVESLSLLLDRHFLATDSRSLRPGWTLHGWVDPDTGDTIELCERRDIPLTWLLIHTADDPAHEALRAALAEQLEFAAPEALLARAAAHPDDPPLLWQAALAAGPEHAAQVHALLLASLTSSAHAVRATAGEIAVLIEARGLAPALDAAAARESDPLLATALRWAADRLGAR